MGSSRISRTIWRNYLKNIIKYRTLNVRLNGRSLWSAISTGRCMRVGYTVLEFIDNRLDHFFSERDLYDVSPFNIDDLRDCIITEIIKDAYYESEKKQSLRANRGSDDDATRMRDSRTMAYAQHYRNMQYNHVVEKTDIKIPELLPDDVQSMDSKIEGHKITEMQYFELETMAEQPLLKAIVNKRICDVKKISNDAFIDYMQEYDKLVNELVAKLDGDDEDVIFATLPLFTLEWKYNVELFYSCAVEAEKHNVKDVPLERLAPLCAELTVPVPPECTTIIHTESRFVLHRLELVQFVYDDPEEQSEEIYDKLCHYFVAKYYIEREIVHKWSMPEYFATHISREKWASFFREHYDLRKIYVKKELTNKRIRYMRKLYEVMIKNMETPTK